MALHVLIADREPVVRESCRRILLAHGYDVATAADGLQCIEQLLSISPDLLVLDPEIPWGGGAGVLSRLQEQAPLKLVTVVIANGHGMADVPSNLNHLMTHRLERPACLADLSGFVHEIQECLLQRQSGRTQHPLEPISCELARSH